MSLASIIHPKQREFPSLYHRVRLLPKGRALLIATAFSCLLLPSAPAGQLIIKSQPGTELDFISVSNEPTAARNQLHTRAQRREMPVSPEVEEKLTKFTERSVDPQKEILTTHMDTVIEAMAKTVQLTAAEKETLKKAVPALIDSYLPQWKTVFHQALRLHVDSMSPAMLRQIEANWQPSQIVAYSALPTLPLPDRTPAWQAQVSTVLDAARLKAWQNALEAQRLEFDKKTADRIAPIEQQTTKESQEILQKQVTDINQLTTAPIEKIDALKTLADKIAKEFGKDNAAEYKATFDNATKATAELMLNPNSYFFPMEVPGIYLINRFSDEAVKVVGPEVIARWQEARKGRDEKLFAQLMADSKPLAEQYRDSYFQQFDQEIVNLAATLQLPEDRKTKLTEGCNAALDAILEEWQKALVQHMLTLPESQRDAVMQGQRGFSLNLPHENQPRQHPLWLKRRAELLSPEESQRWEAILTERRKRIYEAFGRLFIVEIDKEVALNRDQRPKLLPITEKLVAGQLENYGFDITQPSHFHYTYFHNISDTEAAKELTNTLTPKQWEYWKNARDRMRRQPTKLEEDLSGADTETIIARHLYHLDLQERRQRLAQMEMHTSEAVRLASLNETDTKRLQIAAKGAVDSTMSYWRSRMNDWVRQQIRQTTPEALQQRLAGLGHMRFSNNEPEPSQDPLWSTAIMEMLPAEQRQTWQDEQKIRRNYMLDAIATNVLAQFNLQYPITNEQAEQIKPQIITVLNDHEVEFTNWFSDGWYYSPHQVLTPMCGISEETMKNLFGEKQLATLRETVLAQGISYWDSIKQQREQRIKALERQRKNPPKK